jgi:hypothetical protein
VAIWWTRAAVEPALRRPFILNVSAQSSVLWQQRMPWAALCKFEPRSHIRYRRIIHAADGKDERAVPGTWRQPTICPANLGTNACGATAAPSIRRADDRSSHQRRLPMAGDQVLALPDAARCRSMRVAPRADDMRARSRRAPSLPEVQEGWEAPGCHAAPANASSRPSLTRSAFPWFESY